MAKTKKGAVNKSEAVRTYLAANKGAKAGAVVAALAEQGITVPSSLVYAIKAKGKTKRSAKKTTRGAAKTSSGNGKYSIEMLLSAKKLAESLGGVTKAREALMVLEKLS